MTAVLQQEKQFLTLDQKRLTIKGSSYCFGAKATSHSFSNESFFKFHVIIKGSCDTFDFVISKSLNLASEIKADIGLERLYLGNEIYQV